MYSVRLNDIHFIYSNSSLRKVISIARAYSAWLVSLKNPYRGIENRLVVRSNGRIAYIIKGREIKRV